MNMVERLEMRSRGEPSSFTELKAIVGLAVPSVVSSCSSYALTLTDQIMVGHLGLEAMAAAAVGGVLYNLVLFFQLGFLSALSTKAAQAHGAQDKRMIVSCWSASAVAGCLVAIPMMGSLLYAGWVAERVMGQPSDIAAMVGVFCLRLIPSVIPAVLAQSLIAVMQAQNLMAWPVVISLVTFVVNIGFNFLFIGLYGFRGAPLATTASRVVQLLLTAAVSLVIRRRQMAADAARGESIDKGALEWPEVSRCLARGCALKMLVDYCKLGLPGGAMTSLEAASFDVTTALAGFLGPAQLDAHVAMISVISFNFISFPFGIATAATIRVGNLLGEGAAAAARRASWISVALGAGSMAACAAAMLAARDVLSYIFIDDAAVHGYVEQIVLIACAFEVLDGVFGTAQGALRGMGRQFELMVCNFVGLWLAGFSTGYLLTFQAGLGLPGLWLGILLGLSVTATLSVARLMAADWDAEAAKARAVAALAAEERALLGAERAYSGGTLKQQRREGGAGKPGALGGPHGGNSVDGGVVDAEGDELALLEDVVADESGVELCGACLGPTITPR